MMKIERTADFRFILFNVFKGASKECLDDIQARKKSLGGTKTVITNDLVYPNGYSKYTVSFGEQMVSGISCEADNPYVAYIKIFDKDNDTTYEFYCDVSAFDFMEIFDSLQQLYNDIQHERVSYDEDIKDMLYAEALKCDYETLGDLLEVRDGDETKAYLGDKYLLMHYVEDKELALLDAETEDIIVSEFIDDGLGLESIFNPWLDILIDKAKLG